MTLADKQNEQPDDGPSRAIAKACHVT